MRVLVTGGTGFVGSHTAAALVERGHDVRLLVRNPARVHAVLGPHGIEERVEAVVGDVTDADAVGRALDGCDGVIHAAAVVALDRRRDDEIARTNVRATELVLGDRAESSSSIPSCTCRACPRSYRRRDRCWAPTTRPVRRWAATRDRRPMPNGWRERCRPKAFPSSSPIPAACGVRATRRRASRCKIVINFLKSGVIPMTTGGMPVVDVRDLGGRARRVHRARPRGPPLHGRRRAAEHAAARRHPARAHRSPLDGRAGARARRCARRER